MLRRLEKTAGPTVSLDFEGKRIEAAEGDTVAAALLAAGETTFRSTPVSGERRGPYCMMGVCFECLLEIDGIANQQSCMIKVRNGMRVRRQRGRPLIASSTDE